MTFLSPAFLWALAAVSVPLLLHLVRRRKIRVIRWAAWQFLVQSQERLRRRLRLEQMLLAVIRALIIGLIVLAFARPVMLVGQSGRLGGGDAPIHAIIALDNSASMGFERAGRTDFDRARAAADQIIARTLRPGDVASVVLASSSPKAIVKHPSHDLESVRKAIRSARLSGFATDYARVAQACLAICEASRTPRREVFIVTDSQRSGFGETPDPKVAEIWRKVAQVARVTWVRVAPETRPNVSVMPPSLSRDFVTQGTPVRVEADVVNRSGSDLASATVRLEVEGRTAGAMPLSIPRGRTARAAFTHTFSRSGTAYGRIVLDRPDGLAADNAGWLAVRVRSALRALIVGPTEAAPSPPDTLYIATALAPAGASESAASQVLATVRNTVAGAGAPLRSFDVIVLAGVPSLSASEVSALRKHVEAGGGLLAFPSASGLAGLNALAGPGDGAVWHLRSADRRQAPLERAWSLDPVSIAHPALSMFRSADASDLGAAKFTRTVALDIGPEGSVSGLPARTDTTPGANRSRAVLRFADGKPAMLESSIGDGRAILCAFPAGVSGGDLPLKAAYVPLVHQLVAYLASAQIEPRMVIVGQPTTLRFGIETGERRYSVALLSADAETRVDSVVAEGLRAAPGPDSVLLRCPAPEMSGLYTVSAGTGPLSAPSPSERLDAFAANLDPRETDLASARQDLIRAHTGAIPIAFADETDDLARLVRTSRSGKELWPTLLISALALMVVETYLARAFGRRT